VSLTKTARKGLGFKQELIENVKKSVEEYDHILLFTVHNMRNVLMKEVREQWRDSRFFFGKNKVMGIGLKQANEEKMLSSLSKVSQNLVGQCGMLFTNRPLDEAVKFFETHSVADFAVGGSTVNTGVDLDEGPLPEFPHSIEPYLRELGLPTSLQKGVVTLLKPYTVCKKGDVLTHQQAKILRLLGMKLASFKFTLICSTSKDGSYKSFHSPKDLAPKEPLGEVNSQPQKKSPKKKRRSQKTNQTAMEEG